MTYTVKEIFYTLQGEGANSGRAAVFCRFAGCNLWSGREQDRAKAICNFCDTEFVGGTKFQLDELISTIECTWTADAGPKFVVFTGGEPLLQLDVDILLGLKLLGFETAVETNGTIAAPGGIDWLCVSPKVLPLVQTRGDEMKLVYPQPNALPEAFEQLDFEHWFLQPMDGPYLATNTRAAVDYCLAHPRWRVSLQTHKFMGIP